MGLFKKEPVVINGVKINGSNEKHYLRINAINNGKKYDNAIELYRTFEDKEDQLIERLNFNEIVCITYNDMMGNPRLRFDCMPVHQKFLFMSFEKGIDETKNIIKMKKIIKK